MSTLKTQGTRGHARQLCFALNVWTGINGDVLIGIYLLPQNLDGNTYRIFSEGDLPDLISDLPAAIGLINWFRHDGASAHFIYIVREYLR